MLYQKGGNIQNFFTAQEITEDVFKVRELHLGLLAIDFSPEKNLKYSRELESKWIELLPKLENIKSLSLRCNTNSLLFEAICKLEKLEELYIWKGDFEDISSISKCTNLTKVYLDSCGKLNDISPLENLKALQVLSISNSFNI